jgi:hypothetical protein
VLLVPDTFELEPLLEDEDDRLAWLLLLLLWLAVLDDIDPELFTGADL